MFQGHPVSQAACCASLPVSVGSDENEGSLCWLLEFHQGLGYSGACHAPKCRPWGCLEVRTCPLQMGVKDLVYAPWLSFSCGHFCCRQRASLVELGAERGGGVQGTPLSPSVSLFFLCPPKHHSGHLERGYSHAPERCDVPAAPQHGRDKRCRHDRHWVRG